MPLIDPEKLDRDSYISSYDYPLGTMFLAGRPTRVGEIGQSVVIEGKRVIEALYAEGFEGDMLDNYEDFGGRPIWDAHEGHGVAFAYGPPGSPEHDAITAAVMAARMGVPADQVTAIAMRWYAKEKTDA